MFDVLFKSENLRYIYRKKSEKGDSVHLPRECAIKVFKPLPLSDPKSGAEESRSSGAVWAHREFQNLKRMQKAGIPTPKPLFAKKSVLVMEFIGKDGKAAWKLRDYPFANRNAIKMAYEQVIHVSFPQAKYYRRLLD